MSYKHQLLMWRMHGSWRSPDYCGNRQSWTEVSKLTIYFPLARRRVLFARSIISARRNMNKGSFTPRKRKSGSDISSKWMLLFPIQLFTLSDVKYQRSNSHSSSLLLGMNEALPLHRRKGDYTSTTLSSVRKMPENVWSFSSLNNFLDQPLLSCKVADVRNVYSCVQAIESKIIFFHLQRTDWRRWREWVLVTSHVSTLNQARTISMTDSSTFTTGVSKT